MKEYSSAFDYKNQRGSVVTIGTFDGVHIGHKAILKRVIDSAKKNDLDSAVLTFFPHPRMVVQKDSNIKLLNTLSEKKQLLEKTELDHLIIHPFTQVFSRLTAVEYVRDILVNQLNAKKIIIGYDHRFGRNRTANIEDLREFGNTYHFDVEEISAQELDDVAVSSTKIRNALTSGDILTANGFLGYNYVVSGTVVKGKAIGRTLNYPTANLKIVENYKLIPEKGIYITKAFLNEKIVYGMTSIGTNPTVGGTDRTIETFFLDFDGDLYGHRLDVVFHEKLREEQRFDSLDALQAAIKADFAAARAQWGL